MAVPVAFIIGSPRSGTTILMEVLGRHPDVAAFYEPYFLWDFHNGNGVDDRRGAELAAGSAPSLRREFALFARKSRCSLVVEKTPENAFRIPFLAAVFPHGRFIHIIRDGRDCTLSIRTEWNKREAIVRNRDWFGMLAAAHEMLALQPFWRNRLQAMLFELRQGISWRSLLNKSKWHGKVGWGPRFPGWEQALTALDRLTFHAMQWRTSVETARQDLARLPPDQVLTIRYEQLIAEPTATIDRMVAFLGLSPAADLGRDLVSHSVERWRDAFSAEDHRRLDAAIGDVLAELGYSPTVP